jgi:NADH-quinone oxidoreductase subunit J
MTAELILATLIVGLVGTGTYLLLPHRHSSSTRKLPAIAAALVGMGLLGFIWLWSPPREILSGLFFYIFGIAALVGGLLTISSRDPVHSALWFASVILATSGLFLQAGAPFLAAGTVIVYAGAIVVTFLFVIMLAQMEGRAVYDRAARSPGRATFTGFLLLWCLIYSLLSVRADFHRDGQGALLPTTSIVSYRKRAATQPVSIILSRASRSTSQVVDAEGREKPNVAGLGETLFTDHLVTVELTGALLFIALIAAITITNPKRPIRPEDPRTTPTTV